MMDLALLIGCGWLGLVFYGVGSLTSGRQFVIAGAIAVIGCTLSALLGYAGARRRLLSRAGEAR